MNAMTFRVATVALFAHAAVSAASGAVTTYSNPAAFAAAIAGAPQYFEAFNGVTAGPSPALNFGPVSGLAYTVGADGSGPLFNGNGVLSTNDATEDILFLFTGAPVYAFGGNFWTTDIDVSPIPSTITIHLFGAGGGSFSYASGAATDFFGLVSDTPITAFSISSANTGAAPFDWPTADNVTVAGAVPAPATALVLGLGGLLSSRRRRV